MRERKALATVMLAAAVALVAPGCAGKVRITSTKMCAAHGGTFNATSKTCTYTASTRSVQQTCEAQDGYYDTAADICSFNP